MKEIYSMWKYGTMVALTVLCAGLYMLFLLPSKSIPLIPGITEIRPATLLPVLFGLLFGPAGAWGSAIGNLCGDFFGTLSPASIFGFVGNFLYALIPYKLWRRMKIKMGEDRTPTINSAWKLARFGSISFVACTACALVIAWGCDVLKLASFTALSIIILLNNAMINLFLGPLVLPLLYSFFKKRKLLWTDIMAPCDISKPSADKMFSRFVAVGSLGGIGAGITAGTVLAGQTIIGRNITTIGMGNPLTAFILLPFLALLFYGTYKT